MSYKAYVVKLESLADAQMLLDWIESTEMHVIFNGVGKASASIRTLSLSKGNFVALINTDGDMFYFDDFNIPLKACRQRYFASAICSLMTIIILPRLLLTCTLHP